MAAAFPLRGLAPEVVVKIDAAAAAAGSSRNAYIVKVLTEHVQQVRPAATAEAFRQAVGLSADLGNEALMHAAWS